MNLRYCAWLRDSMGCSSEQVVLPDDVRTVGMLLDWLPTRDERSRSAFEYIDVVLVSVNLRYASRDDPVRDEDEVILAPPIAGG
ncbi:MoaD/ThiS family protein [Ramlibacter sp. RBP-2]|uniref:MoaD/ThiS family protein n=1 Tax=Ramlibacter lithotrophicus TaxID=2606681 RepID=A0A7X6I5W2_9BURK|nr:MoaD/ThiS family protein [Ramlibacter lithotrophicus]NKE65605.1 MoaD/ThiS family protein [Ramlibacter lithotrophicus]